MSFTAFLCCYREVICPNIEYVIMISSRRRYSVYWSNEAKYNYYIK